MEIGDRVGNFVVRHRVGEGGMGAVFLAENPLIGRRVGVKVLHQRYATDAAIARRFVDEAMAANRIRNDHVVRIEDYGSLPDGTPYLLMEWLEGCSLAAELKENPRLPPARAVHIASQVAEAVEAAHASGIVHRDLKPDNVFLVPQKGNPDFVKVLDFGIAKIMDEESGRKRTETGVAIGTPDYMSPEQCRGAQKEVDHRTDVYSLGVMLYEMVTGSLPFVGVGPGDLFVKHIMEPPEPPNARNTELPPALNQMILRMMEKQPAARFQTMAEVEEALHGLRLAPPTSSAQPAERQGVATVVHRTTPVVGQMYVEPRPTGRKPIWVAFTVTAALGLAIGAVALLRGRTPGEDGGKPVAESVAVEKKSDEPLSASDKKNASLLADYLAAADRGDWDAAVARREELPDNSPWRAKADATWPAIRGHYVDKYLGIAREKVAAHHCEEAKSAIEKVLMADDANSTAMEIAKKCNTEASAEAAARVAKANDKRTAAIPGNAGTSKNAQSRSGADVARTPRDQPPTVKADRIQETKQPSAVATPPAASPADAPPAIPGDPATVEANDAYVHGLYDESSRLANEIVKKNPDNTRAWRLVGASGCFLKKRSDAERAWNKLGSIERKFLRYVCQRNGIEMP